MVKDTEPNIIAKNIFDIRGKSYAEIAMNCLNNSSRCYSDYRCVDPYYKCYHGDSSSDSNDTSSDSSSEDESLESFISSIEVSEPRSLPGILSPLDHPSLQSVSQTVPQSIAISQPVIESPVEILQSPVEIPQSPIEIPQSPRTKIKQKLTERLSSDEETDSNTCICCEINKRCVAYINCGHMSYCIECTIKAIEKNLNCPICRTESNDVLIIFQN